MGGALLLITLLFLIRVYLIGAQRAGDPWRGGEGLWLGRPRCLVKPSLSLDASWGPSASAAGVRVTGGGRGGMGTLPLPQVTLLPSYTQL